MPKRLHIGEGDGHKERCGQMSFKEISLTVVVEEEVEVTSHDSTVLEILTCQAVTADMHYAIMLSE